MGRSPAEMAGELRNLASSGTGSAQGAVEILEAAGDSLTKLPFVGIHSVMSKPGDLDEARRGVFRVGSERFELSPPVDWWDEPYSAPGERGFFQNSFVFADPLLGDPAFPDVLAPLAEIFADWVAAHPDGDAVHPHPYAWHDHAAAGRLVIMAFTLREGIRREMIDRAVAETLAAGVLQHAQYLVGEENYAAHYNHGLFSDAALALAARSLAPLPQAPTWREVAERRFEEVLSNTLDNGEAMHLEHSPNYHWIIHGAVSRFAAAGIFQALDLAGLASRMEDSGAWLVAPDGTLPPIGDTSPGEKVPRAIAEANKALSGMRVFPASGYASIRHGDSTLIVTAAHHPTAHKHADDGSFCLYEAGRPVILDPGDPSHQYGSPERRYGTSPAAHATICVDGFDWTEESSPHGSGMVASAQRDGVYAVLTRNPGAVRGGGDARRALVYVPGHFLLILDDVEASPGHQLVRSLPIAPGLGTSVAANGDVGILEGGRVVARVVQVSELGRPLDGVEISIGQRVPEMSGFFFPTPIASEPRCDVRFSGEAGHPRGLALIIGKERPEEAAGMGWERSALGVDVSITGLTASALDVRIGSNTIAIGAAD